MNSVFFIAFVPMLKAISQIFMVMIAGGVFIKKKILPDEIFNALSRVLVLVTLPCLSFSKIIKGLDVEKYPNWWVLPVVAILMTAGTLIVSYLFFFKGRKIKRDLIALSTFQNCTFFVLPIGQLVYADRFDEFSLFVFLFALSANPLLWSVAKILISNNSEVNFKKFLTPPACASLTALAVVLLGLQDFIPNFILAPIELLGSATVPIATFVLGATLSHASISHMPKFFDSIRYISIKFFIVPIVTICFLLLFNVKENYPLMCDFLIIQSAAAPAAALTIQVRHYGGNVKRTGSAMLAGYALCLFVLPMWLGIWSLIS